MRGETDEPVTNRTVEPGESRDVGQDESVRTLMASTFRGKMAWMSVVVFLYIPLLLAAAVVSAVMFFRAETTRGMILAAAVFIVAAVWMPVTKLWYWNMMWRNSIIARIDRLEHRLARRSGRQDT